MSLDLELDHRAILTGHLQVNVVVLRLHSFLQPESSFDQPRTTRTEAERLQVSAISGAKLQRVLVFPGLMVQPFCLQTLTQSARSRRQTWATISGDRTLIQNNTELAGDLEVVRIYKKILFSVENQRAPHPTRPVLTPSRRVSIAS